MKRWLNTCIYVVKKAVRVAEKSPQQKKPQQKKLRPKARHLQKEKCQQKDSQLKKQRLPSAATSTDVEWRCAYPTCRQGG
jgi:hypothetical protein